MSGGLFEEAVLVAVDVELEPLLEAPCQKLLAPLLLPPQLVGLRGLVALARGDEGDGGELADEVLEAVHPKVDVVELGWVQKVVVQLEFKLKFQLQL